VAEHEHREIESEISRFTEQLRTANPLQLELVA
jgi:hypothetical protein